MRRFALPLLLAIAQPAIPATALPASPLFAPCRETATVRPVRKVVHRRAKVVHRVHKRRPVAHRVVRHRKPVHHRPILRKVTFASPLCDTVAPSFAPMIGLGDVGPVLAGDLGEVQGLQEAGLPVPVAPASVGAGDTYASPPVVGGIGGLPGAPVRVPVVVRVVPPAVPEPVTWVMMLAGFGLVGAAARQRRSAAHG